ncbi:hypothetical protein Ddc_05917 [Ditylenchus destructor]|nr:hypothetical protein Ddc_05917 [Ditylenchus destructor]
MGRHAKYFRKNYNLNERGSWVEAGDIVIHARRSEQSSRHSRRDILAGAACLQLFGWVACPRSVWVHNLKLDIRPYNLGTQVTRVFAYVTNDQTKHAGVSAQV